MLGKRSHQPEWIDLGKNFYTPTEYRDCLYQLDRIGRFLGGDNSSFWAFKQLSTTISRFKSILDVGCGGGLFTLRLANRYPQAQVVGIDISADAIHFAKARLNEQRPLLSNVQFSIADSPQLDKNIRYDVVIATLVCHHLSDEELILFLKQACLVANQTIILNDLHRHFLATIGFATIVPLFFRNRLIWHDGLLSIRRSFTHQEWKNFLEAAGIDESCYTISWHWAFRWIIMIDAEKLRERDQ